MDNERWSGTIAVLAFGGSLVSWVGLLISILDADAVLAAVTLAGATYCGGIWAWHIGSPLDVPGP